MSRIEFPRVTRPRASVIILPWRQTGYLYSCFAALRQQATRTVPFEVIVVLADPSPEVEHLIRSTIGGVQLVVLRANLGFAEANNQAAALARGEYLVFLNDDAVPEADWLTWLVETADAHPAAGAVGSCMLFPDGRIQESGSIVWNDGSTMPIGRDLPGDALDWQFVRRADYCSACSLLVRKTTWDAVGGMDAEYFPILLRRHGLVPGDSRTRPARAIRASFESAASRIGELAQFEIQGVSVLAKPAPPCCQMGTSALSTGAGRPVVAGRGHPRSLACPRLPGAHSRCRRPRPRRHRWVPDSAACSRRWRNSSTTDTQYRSRQPARVIIRTRRSLPKASASSPNPSRRICHDPTSATKPSSSRDRTTSSRWPRPRGVISRRRFSSTTLRRSSGADSTGRRSCRGTRSRDSSSKTKRGGCSTSSSGSCGMPIMS